MFCHDFICTQSDSQPENYFCNTVDLVLFTSLNKVTKWFFKKGRLVCLQARSELWKNYLALASRSFFLVRPFQSLLLHWKRIPWSYCRLTARPVSVTNSFKCSQDLTFKKKNILQQILCISATAGCLWQTTWKTGW